jgi:hypothetical protein
MPGSPLHRAGGLALHGSSSFSREPIPVAWIPEAAVGADIRRRLKGIGLDVEVISLQLVPSITGGQEWVRRDCQGGVKTLSNLAERAPIAAILYCPKRVAPAVVTTSEGQLRAFGPAFGAGGLALKSDALLGADIIVPIDPLAHGVRRFARILGIDRLLRDWIRHRRLKRGVNPFVAH